MTAAPLVIIGHIRSGTTVLADLLRAYCPEATSFGDTDFEDRHFWSGVGARIGSPLTGTRCLAAGAADVTPAGRRLAGERLAERSRDGHVITKNPHLSNKLGFVRELFPQARFVHLVRQDLSVIASTKRRFHDSHGGANAWESPFLYYWPADEHLPCWWSVPVTDGLQGGAGAAPPPDHEEPARFLAAHPDGTRYVPGDGFGRLAESWVRINAGIVGQLGRLADPHACLHVNYADLVDDPRTVLGEVARFAGVTVTDPHGVPVRLDATRSQAWRGALDLDEQATCAAVLNTLSEQVELLARTLPGPLFAR